jgi:hypothetical protein
MVFSRLPVFDASSSCASSFVVRHSNYPFLTPLFLKILTTES